MKSNAATAGLIIAAPASGSGKTTITLALLRTLRERGVRVASMKIGPDFIDPAFHQMASGHECINLDDWAMSEQGFAYALEQASQGTELIIAEGVMGLFDGSGTGRGSTADVAARLGWPVILVLDASGMAASAAAMAQGFINHRNDVDVVGVVVNRLGGDKHQSLIEAAMQKCNIPVLGMLKRREDLQLPSRHLGLVQATEHPGLEDFMHSAAQWLEQGVDVDALTALAQPSQIFAQGVQHQALPALGQHIAIARDAAFGFCYPLTVRSWRAQGAQVSFFSPLADEGPDENSDAVYLPGGYPELHAEQLAANTNFLNAMRMAASRNVTIYGECGGYMVLGKELIDGDGLAHRMCGLLPLTTSFAKPKMTLGYRQVQLIHNGPLGLAGTNYRGHEFHFAQTIDHTLAHGEALDALWQARDAAGNQLPDAGMRKDTVCGSFIHLVDRAD